MRIYKCDRCGEEFEAYDFTFPLFLGEKNPAKWEKIQLKSGEHIKELSICQKCLRSFIDWMHGDEAYDEYDRRLDE